MRDRTTAGHGVFISGMVRGSRQRSKPLFPLITSPFGGEIELNAPVRSFADLPAADVTLFDTTPQAVAEILGAKTLASNCDLLAEPGFVGVQRSNDWRLRRYEGPRNRDTNEQSGAFPAGAIRHLVGA